MAEMAELQPRLVRGPGAGHVHCDGAVDAAAHDGLAKRTATADLLGHCEHLHAEPRSFVLQDAGVAFNRIEIKHIGVGGELALLMQAHRAFDESRIAATQDVEEHQQSPSAVLFAQRHCDCCEDD